MSKKVIHKGVLVGEIEATAATQVRVKIDTIVVEEYAEAMLARNVFPPLIVFAEKGSERYMLADGFHRLAAAKQADLTEIACEIHEGGMHDALAWALGANDNHGLRRTRKDKRNAVELALKDPEWTSWSNVEISRLCRVGEKLVRTVREELVVSGEIDEQDTVKTRRGGKVVKQKAHAGTRSAKPTSPDSEEKSGTSKKKNGRKSQDQANRDDVYAALDTIKVMPFSGTEAARRWGTSRLPDVEYCAEWLQEYLDAARALDSAA